MRAMADKNEWLFSWGYHKLWHGKLDRKTLDAVSATRPIVIWQRSCHEFYLNTAAIKALGLTEDGDEGQGRRQQDVQLGGRPLVGDGDEPHPEPLLKVFATPERMVFGLKQMVAYLHQNGVTAYMEPGRFLTPDIWKLYQQILGADGHALLQLFRRGRPHPGGFRPRPGGVAGRHREADRPGAPGQGVLLPRPDQALCRRRDHLATHADEGRLHRRPPWRVDDDAGRTWISGPALLERGIPAPHPREWRPGSRNRARHAGKPDAGEPRRADHRSVIVHFACSTEEQVARIARLGAIVSANPYYTVGFADKYAEFGLGPQRADAMVRSASVLKRHIPLSFHSDLPMGPSAPLNFVWCAVNRVTPSGRVAGPEQRIGVEDALRAVTIEAAYSWRKENELGSIAPGKIANFTVLEQDPLAVEPMKLNDIPIWGTVFEGRVFPIAVKARKAAATMGSPLLNTAT